MRGQFLRLFVVATVCLLIVAGCATSPQLAPPAPTSLPPSPAPTLDPRMELAQAFEDGLNRGDGAAVASLFVEEGMGYMDSGSLLSDKAAVADYIEEGAGRHWSLQLSECAAQGVLWHCKSVEHEDCMRAGVGLDELRTDMTLTQQEGKIQYIEFKPSAEVGAAMEQATEKFWTWVRAERDAEWKLVATPGGPLPARERGELLSKLCKEYVEAHR